MKASVATHLALKDPWRHPITFPTAEANYQIIAVIGDS